MSNYHFPFAVNGTPNVGDVVTWDGQQWIPQAATGVGTWAQVLVNGNVSGGTNPVISNGDSIQGEDSAVGNGGDLNLLGGAANPAFTGGNVNITGANGDNGGGIFLQGGAGDTLNGGDIVCEAGASLNGGVGGAWELNAGDGTEGGRVDIFAGDALVAENAGGNVDIRAGASPGGETGTGGNIFCEPGTSGSLTTAGSIRLRHGGGEDAIVISQEPAAPHLGNRAILVTAAGLSFFDGTPAERPSVTGSRGGNAALASLLTVLDSMGLITDNTTA